MEKHTSFRTVLVMIVFITLILSPDIEGVADLVALIELALRIVSLIV